MKRAKYVIELSEKDVEHLCEILHEREELFLKFERMRKLLRDLGNKIAQQKKAQDEKMLDGDEFREMPPGGYLTPWGWKNTCDRERKEKNPEKEKEKQRRYRERHREEINRRKRERRLQLKQSLG